VILPSASLLLSLYLGNDMASAFHAASVIGSHLRRAAIRFRERLTSIKSAAIAKCVKR